MGALSGPAWKGLGLFPAVKDGRSLFVDAASFVGVLGFWAG